MSANLLRQVQRLARPQTTLACRHLLVGPPDPVSNLRPVIYDDSPSVPPASQTPPNHPYSLSEFKPQSPNKIGPHELQFKLQMQQLDALNQSFWVDSNSRFEAGKQAVLASIPESASPRDREHVLSEFYRQWLVQERTRTEEYTAEWRRHNIACITLAIRVQYHNLTTRLAQWLKFW